MSRRRDDLPPGLADRLGPVCDLFAADWQAGRRPRLEDFLPQADEPDRPALLHALLAVELEQRRRQGESPSPDDYRQRLPGYAALIDDAFAPSATGPDGPAVTPTGAPPAAAAVGPGLRVSRYAPEEEIAHGGMGAVWRARDLDLGRTLAVKVLLQRRHGQAELGRRFRAEAQITGQLQHPGIPPVHAVGTLPDGRPFFALKLIKGRTLDDLLGERSTPADDLPRFLGIFGQVCQTLAYAHSRGVIHRDLKPSNVMVGAFGEVQVMDWGLAKVLGEAPAAAAEPADTSTIATVRTGGTGRSSQEGDVLGTPAYMAPEQARGEIDVLDERCDVFGLGALLCVVLTGAPPYRSGSRGEVQARAARGDLGDALARLEASAADAELIPLARRCLAAEREDRPRHAGEVAQAVAAYLDGVQQRLREAERQRAAAEARAEGERRARRLWLGLAAAVLLLVLLGGGGAWLVQQQRAAALTHQRQTEQETRLILERGRGLLEAGWQANDLDKLKEASAEAARAVDVARSGGAGAAVQGEAAGFRDEVGSRLERATQDRALLTALLDVAAPHETRTYTSGSSGTTMALAEPSVDERYAAAFRRWGLDVDGTAEAEVVARLGREPEAVVQEVVAGLDGWMLERRRQKRPEADWRRLFRLAEQLDRGPRHRELLALLAGQPAPDAASVAGLVGRWPPWPALWELARGDQWRRLQEERGGVDAATEPVLTVALLAQACAALGDGAGAEAVLRQALAARPGELVLLESLGGLLERQRPSRRGEAIECYRAARALRPNLGVALGKALVRADRASEGEAVLRDLIRQQPDNPEIRLYLGGALYAQRKLSEAAAAWQKAIALQPDYAEAYYNLGTVLLAQRKLSEAVAAYHKAIALQPENALAYNNLGIALHEQGKLPEAVAAYRKAIDFKPDYAAAYANLGAALRAQGKLSEAVAACQKAIGLQPGDALAYTNLGAALHEQGKLSEAVATFQKAIALQPDLAEAYNNLGIVLLAQGKLPEAVAAFRKAIELKPDDALAYTSLGDALRQQGKLSAAVAACQKAIGLQPGDAKVYYGLGNALRDQGKLPEAVTAYRKAIELKPDYAEAHCNLGLALGAQGEFADALASLKRGHELGSRRPNWRYPSAAWVRRAERLLQLDSRLPKVLRGESQPTDAAERVELAELCQLPCKQLYAAAARFYRDALAAEPKLAADSRSWHRYNAACCAALAGCGRGKDADQLDAPARARWRQQARARLRADLAAWGQALDTGKAPARAAVQQALRHWQTDADLAGVRDPDALAKLPEAERQDWQHLWADVAALLAKAGAAK